MLKLKENKRYLFRDGTISTPLKMCNHIEIDEATEEILHFFEENGDYPNSYGFIYSELNPRNVAFVYSDDFEHAKDIVSEYNEGKQE